MIEQLDNNEQILLMYLADELPPGDRLEVEQMLAADATLRADLERLRAAQQTTTEVLALLDASSPVPVNAGAATRRVGRDIRQWLAQPAVEARAPAAGRGRRSWRWAFPAAAAAAIVVAGAVWVSRHGLGVSGPDRHQYAKSDGNPEASPFTAQADPAQAEPEPVFPQSPQPAPAESSYALLVDSFPAPPVVDEPQSVAMSNRPTPSEDAIPLDELSQYLLNSDSTQ